MIQKIKQDRDNEGRAWKEVGARSSISSSLTAAFIQCATPSTRPLVTQKSDRDFSLEEITPQKT